MKSILIINQYASNPDTGFGGRSYYLAQSLAKYSKVTLVYGSFNHLLKTSSHQKSFLNFNEGSPFYIKSLKTFIYSSSRSPLRIVNWFIFAFKLCLLNNKSIGFKPSEIIYSSPSLPAYLGAYILAKKFSCPLYFEVRDIWPMSVVELGSFSRNNLLVILLRQIEKFAYKSSDGIISNLANIKNHISKYTNKQIKFHYSPNGISKNKKINKDFKNSKTLNTIIKDLGKLNDSGKHIIGYVGGLAPANAMNLFIDSALLAKNDSKLFFVVVGDGPEKKNLELICKSLNLKNIKFYEGVAKNEVQIVLQTIDILFLANQFKKIYSYGISPMKLPEYLESKKPIIHVTNSISLLEEFKCWEVVKEYKPSAVIKSIYNLQKLKEFERIEMGDKAESLCRKSLDYNNLANSLLSFLGDKTNE